jgi:hypothetical protein
MKFITIASFLSKEMRRKSMEGVDKDVFSIRGHSQKRKNKSSGGRSKSRGISKHPRQSIRKGWKYSKVVHYKKDRRSKNVDKRKGFDDAPSIEMKISMEQGGDVYMQL